MGTTWGPQSIALHRTHKECSGLVGKAGKALNAKSTECVRKTTWVWVEGGSWEVICIPSGCCLPSLGEQANCAFPTAKPRQHPLLCVVIHILSCPKEAASTGVKSATVGAQDMAPLSTAA